MRSEVESVLEVIRNALRMDGGDIELVEIADDGVVSVKLTGACAGCPFSQMTLKNFVERELKKNVDGIKEVVAV
ncbi:NifU family protein [Methanotrichaceae archaeon Mx]|uniref:NifU family protein n=1 Tax=Candidatus Methanocrinis natronophilus TaxID=3033396 RepID=A0ABT5X9F4_9EURY|nr:NifU family protein [Candidatus Methanocrinis natronophilus]MDF0591339.1 NifU family protein [Candidatus Methanocrinis natronophilus]